MKNPYIYTDLPALAKLQERYDQLHKAGSIVAELQAACKKAENDRQKNFDRNNPRHIELERDYDAAYLRLSHAINVMHPLLQPLWDTAQKIRRRQSEGCYLSEELATLLHNVVVAETLYDQCCQVYFKFVLIHPRHFYGIKLSFERTIPEPRAFVLATSGHGSSFRFDGTDPNKPPPPPYMTRREAELAACSWESYADTIGGRAEVIDVRTWKSEHE